MIDSECYKFTKHEKELIKKVNQVYKLDNLDPYTLYKYGLYVNILAGINKGISKKKITETFNNLDIKSKNMPFQVLFLIYLLPFSIYVVHYMQLFF